MEFDPRQAEESRGHFVVPALPGQFIISGCGDWGNPIALDWETV
jgi:hypothetical protein